MRFAFARVEIDLWAPLPERRLESWRMRGVGTTSWFLLPISTWSDGELLLSFLGWQSGTYGGQNTPVLGCEVAEVSSIELHVEIAMICLLFQRSS